MRRPALPLILVAVGLLPPLLAVDSRSFWGAEEASYAQGAREMLETRDFTAPRIDGQVSLDRPPLGYWLLALSFWVFGSGFAAAVVANTVLTVLTAFLVARHAEDTAPGAGAWTAIAYLTMLLPAAAARSATADAALALCTTAAVVFFLRPGWTNAALSGACLGLGTLAGGPVACMVVLPAMLAAVMSDREARLLRTAGVLALGALVALTWRLALAARGLEAPPLAGFPRGARVEGWGLRAPWWFHLPALLLLAFPWSTHLFLGVFGPARPRAAGGRGLPAEAAAVAVPLVLLTALRNERLGYLLPLLPWLACWLGRALASVRGGARHPAWKPLAALAIVVVPNACLVGLPVLIRDPGWGFVPSWTAAALLALGAGLAIVGLIELAELSGAAWVGLGALALGTWVVLDTALVPFLEGRRTERAAAEAVRRQLAPGSVPVAHRYWSPVLVAHGVRQWQRTRSRHELEAFLSKAREAGRQSLVVAGTDSEGDVRAAALASGGSAREVFRFSGSIDRRLSFGELAGFRLAQGENGGFFHDFDQTVEGESGFSLPERGPGPEPVVFRWTQQMETALPVVVPAAEELVLRVRAWGIARPGTPQDLHLLFATCPVGAVRLPEGFKTFTLPVDPGCRPRGPARLLMRTRHLVRPAAADPGSPDQRTLGAALDWLAIEPRGHVQHLEPRAADARLDLTSVSVSGDTVTVRGSGFSPLAAINFFMAQGETTANLGGLDATGLSKLPLTFVDPTELRFTLPAGARPGPAFVTVLNPPYTPFASSGDDPDGRFRIP